MQYEQPVYSDGIVKNRQDRFRGLNHNQGAGDGQIYEMHNLGSDFYPVMATRMKRRNYRKLTKCNGLFAADKLCWVDGSEFFYDGVKKGDVEDSRKAFTAINDIILIYPDNKYYDIKSDTFGLLSSVYDTADPIGKKTIIHSQATVHDTVISGEQEGIIHQPSTSNEPGYLNKEFAFTHNSVRVNNDEHWFTEDLVGRTIRISDAETITKMETAFTVRSWDEETETLFFDDNSFAVQEGETSVANAHIALNATMNTAEFVADRLDTEGRASLFRYVDVNTATWMYVVSNLKSGVPIRIEGSSIEENNKSCICRGFKYVNGIMYMKVDTDTFAEGISSGDSAYRTSIVVNGGTEISWEYREENTRTVVLNSAGWLDRGFEEGKYVRISGSSLEEMNGTYLITNGAAANNNVLNLFHVSAGSTEDVTEDTAGVTFELLTGAMIFDSDSITVYGVKWSDYFEAGDLVEITGCSIEENNGVYTVEEINDESYSIGFMTDSFTAGTDANFETVLRTQRPGFLEFRDGTLYGVAAESNTIRVKDIDWSEYFKVGDVVEISGCSEENNNQTIIIREIEGDELRFYENSFVNSIDTVGTVRRPGDLRLTYACECDNRIWGFKDQTVYASKLGDPFNFSAYDGLGTDSWTVDLGGFKKITGCIDYQGYPTFFTDGELYKVYGSEPSNFELIRTATTGCAPGSERSPAIAGETLFWMNRNGVCAYAGGMPTMINAAFGTERYRNAVAGSDGEKYYISTEDVNGVWHLFVYDVRRGMWHEEDNTQVIGFAYWEGNLYYADSEGNIKLTGNLKFHPEDSEEEESFDWWAEFTDFVDDSPNKKGINKFQIRMELDEDETDPPSVTVKLMLDSDGEWIIPEGGTIEDPEKRSYILPIIPRRADHYRLRIEGHGGCRIYSIAKEYYQGSDFKSQPGRH